MNCSTRFARGLGGAIMMICIAGAALARTPAPPPESDPIAPIVVGANSSAGADALSAAEAQANAQAESASQSDAVAAARQAQLAAALGQGGDGGAGGNAEANGGRSDSTSSAFGGRSRSSSNAVGQVEVGGDQSVYKARALAVNLPTLVAAPAVAGECLEHTRGVGILGGGVTGSTKLNKDCRSDVKCLAIADRLAAYGFPEAAARQLVTCGGVTLAPEDRRQGDASVTREELAAIRQDLADEKERNERRFKDRLEK